MSIKIPNRIQVGEKTYSIKKCSALFKILNPNVRGQINYRASTIKLEETKDLRDKEKTFFHELAHAVINELSFNHPWIEKARNDEAFTSELGLVLRRSFLNLMEKQKEK